MEVGAANFWNNIKFYRKSLFKRESSQVNIIAKTMLLTAPGMRTLLNSPFDPVCNRRHVGWLLKHTETYVESITFGLLLVSIILTTVDWIFFVSTNSFLKRKIIFICCSNALLLELQCLINVKTSGSCLIRWKKGFLE